MYAIYARQSVEKKDSISISMQIDLCKSRLPCEETVEVYKDKGYSGTNINRPDFQRMLNDARQGLIRGIIVYKLDRISRSLADFARLWEELEQRKIELFSYSEGLDTKTPMGQMLVKLLIMFAEMEQKTISARIRDNYHARAEKKLPLGGVPPFGYNRDWSENTAESNIVRQCYSRYISGKSFDKIGRQLGFSGTKAARIIRNPAYVMCSCDVLSSLVASGYKLLGSSDDFRDNYGILAIRSEGEHFAAPANHMGFIESEIWLAAQELINLHKPSSNGGSGNTSWLQGLILCGKCGGSCYIRDNGKGRPYLYITCRGKRNGSCDGLRGIRAETVESLADETMSSEIEKLFIGEKMIINESEHFIDKIETEILRIIEESKNTDTMRLLSLERKRELLMRKSAGKIISQQSVKSMWKKLSFSEKKAIARILIKNIIVTEEKTILILR